MNDWLKQQSTKLGFALVVITALSVLAQYGKIGYEWPAMASAIAAALGLIVDDKGVKPKSKPGASPKGIMGVLLGAFSAGFLMSHCGALPVPKTAQIQAATAIGCAVLQESGCYSELKAAFPTMSQANCTETVDKVISLAEQAQELWKQNTTSYGSELNKLLAELPDGTINLGYWDPQKVDPEKIAALRNGKCAKVVKALGAK